MLRMSRNYGARGFTLLELILALAVVAALAGSVVVALGGAEDAAHGGLARRELAQVREAVRRFHADTGYLPRTGPFALETSPGGRVPVGDAAAFGVAAADAPAWFASPANLLQLFVEPQPGVAPGAVAHPLFRWDPDRRRGWNGPYLARGGEGLVRIGADLLPDGSGDPRAGALLARMPGVLDPQLALPLRVSPGSPVGYFLAFPWGTPASEAAESAHMQAPQGRPVLLFVDPPALARVVGLGPDGAFAAFSTATSPALSGATGPTHPDSDDLGLFVLR